MDSEVKYDRFWIGALSASMVAPAIHYLMSLILGLASSDSDYQTTVQDVRPILLSSIILVLLGRWLLVTKKMDNAGRGFFLVLIPLVLASLYFVLGKKHG